MGGYKFSVCKLLQIKSPFHFMSASWRKNFKALRRVCRFPIFDLCHMYGIFLGILGMCLSVYDIVKIVKYGPELPCCCGKRKLKALSLIKPEYERDVKLIKLILSFEYYTLIVIGTGLRNSGLLIPWLTLYAFMIIGDIIFFFLNLFYQGCDFDKYFLSCGILLVYNWLAIFCLFLHMKTHNC